MDPIQRILKQDGPSRSSRIAKILQDEFAIDAATARKRLSRVKQPIRRFPLRLLPKNESFLYLQDQRRTELFWTNLMRDLRETN